MGNRKRNSSIELLRIIAMFMILEDHFIVHNGIDVNTLPGYQKYFFILAMQMWGKIGAVIFFAISAWFLFDPDKTQTLRKNMRRVWILERELLFWSIVLACSFALFDRRDFSAKLFVESFAPLTFDKWWYVTAYAIFLLFLPFLSQGLRLLGSRRHLELALVLLCLWGITSFIPGAVRTTEYAGFLYLAVLISAYRWYFNTLSRKQIWGGILVGCAFIALYLIISLIVSTYGKSVGIFITNDFISIPVILIGFGIFLLFDQISFYSPVINSIAKSSLAVYLITDYPASERLLWVRLFNLKRFMGIMPYSLAVLKIYGILLALFTACIVLDYGRRGLFALAVNRHPGHWFDLLWPHLETVWNRSAIWMDRHGVLKR